MNLDESCEIPTMTFEESVKFPLEHEEVMKIYNTNTNCALELLNTTFFSSDNKKYNCIGKRNHNSEEIVYIYTKFEPQFIAEIGGEYGWYPLQMDKFRNLVMNHIFEFLFEKFLKKYNFKLNQAMYDGWQWALAAVGLQLDIIDGDVYEINDMEECKCCDENINKNINKQESKI